MAGRLKVTILGCGSSGGVPRVGGDWGACDPKDSKNRRMRCSVLVDYWDESADAPTSVIVDTSPDLREQLLRHNVKRLDAVLFTHEHADQTNGIDDMRAIAYRMGKRMPVYMDEPTKNELFQRFNYCFEKPEGRVHPPILEPQDVIAPGQTLEIEGPGGVLSTEVLGLSHGPTTSLGFKFAGKIAYTPDVWDVPHETLATLDDIDIWILDALRYNPHPTHAHTDKSLSWIARTRTRKAVFTNLHIDMDYKTFSNELHKPHQPAYKNSLNSSRHEPPSIGSSRRVASML